MAVLHLFAWGGLALCVLAVYLWWRARRFLENARTVEGRVVRLAVGETVLVAYDPQDPSDARVRGARIYAAPIIVYVIGAGWLALGLVGLLW